MAKYIKIPFGTSASRTTIPDSDSSSVSWTGGYTSQYELNPQTNSNAKHIERDIFNSLFYEITSAIQQLQLNGVTPYYEDIIASTGPGYSEGAIVSYGGKLWRSRTSSNKVIPNATSTDKWEQIYGYESLKAQLTKDGIGSGGGGSSDTYTRTEINAKFDAINDTLGEYLYKEQGEIYLLTWTGTDRNEAGFFMCNGDKLDYDLDDSSKFFGNQLYQLCYVETDDGRVTSNFYSRWNIKIDSVNKTVTLPNILGLRSDGTIASETDRMLLSMGKTSGTPSLNTNVVKFTTSGTDANTYFFKMIPCVYLGVQND